MQVAFQYGGEGGGGSEGEKLLLIWDSFLQSQEIEVEYSMSSTDDIKRMKVMLMKEKDEYSDEEQNLNGKYKNSSLRAMRAALGRRFKDTRSLDIISNEKFYECNKLFGGVLRTNKHIGHGDTKSKEPITEEDLAKLNTYFEDKMRSKPDAQALQFILLF